MRFRDITAPRMENQMEKNMENETQTGMYRDLSGLRCPKVRDAFVGPLQSGA